MSKVLSLSVKGLLYIRRDWDPPEQQVDEDELAQVAESLGWLQLSAESWDDDEVE